MSFHLYFNTLLLTTILPLPNITVAQSADTTPIDLNNVFSDTTVLVASDGSSATFNEIPFFSPVSLINDPGLGDTNVIIADVGTRFLFDFNFTEATTEDDFFNFSLTGISFGSVFEFSIDFSATGYVAIDMSSLVGNSIGATFQLGSNFYDTGSNSTVFISNVTLSCTELFLKQVLFIC